MEPELSGNIVKAGSKRLARHPSRELAGVTGSVSDGGQPIHSNTAAPADHRSPRADLRRPARAAWRNAGPPADRGNDDVDGSTSVLHGASNRRCARAEQLERLENTWQDPSPGTPGAGAPARGAQHSHDRSARGGCIRRGRARLYEPGESSRPPAHPAAGG